MSSISSISNATNQLSSVYGQIASGNKLTSASKGAAELAISETMKKDIGGFDQGSKNLDSVKNAFQISDGAIGQITDNLQRMRELSVQASNGLYTAEDKQSIQDEIEQLKQGINEIASNTTYNGLGLINGENDSFQVATSASSNLSSYSNVNATLENLGLSDFDVTKDFDISQIDKAIESLSSSRSSIGAQTNGLYHAMNMNSAMSFNTTASSSRITDTEYGKAINEMKKNQVLQSYALQIQQKRMEEEQQKYKNMFI